MTNRSIWTSYVGPPGTYVSASTNHMGINFVPSVDGLVTALKWYRGGSGAGWLPARIALWNRSSGNKVAEVVAPTDNNTVGWKEYTLVSPAALAQGVTYTVAYDQATGQNSSRIALGAAPTPDANLAIPNPARAYRAGSLNLFPNTTDNSFMDLVDIVFDDAGTGPPPDDPASAADVDAILASWLTLGAGNDHVGQLPNQTYEELTDTATGLPGIRTDIAAVDTKVTTENTRSAGLVGGTIQSAVTATQTALAAGTAAVQTGVTAIGTGVTAIGTVVSDVLGLVAKGPAGIAHSTDPGWEEVDSGAFTGSFFVDARCDRVYVHITTIGDDRPTNEVEGFEFLTAPWPWYVILANQVGEYRTSMAREAVLFVPGMRMDGVLVKLPPDCAGTWTASLFTG